MKDILFFIFGWAFQIVVALGLLGFVIYMIELVVYSCKHTNESTFHPWWFWW